MDNEHIESLLLSMADGDEKAFESLYLETKATVYGFSLSFLKNKYDAEDVMQNTYVSIYHSVGSYKPHGKPMAWILRIAKNFCLMKLRESSRQADEDIEEYKDILEAETGSIEDKLFVQNLLKILSDEDLQIVILHAVTGFKFNEIASLLDLALPTVLSKYNRSMKKLRDNLSKEAL